MYSGTVRKPSLRYFVIARHPETRIGGFFDEFSQPTDEAFHHPSELHLRKGTYKGLIMLPKVVAKNRTRIVIADDHTVLGASLAALLSTQPDFVVGGGASSGPE